ncbi:MAG: PIN domain-containing protein [Acidobacteriota bacterium]
MRAAYVDTSVVVAVTFGEPVAHELIPVLKRCDRLLSSNLLEAEFRSVVAREMTTERNETYETKARDFLDGIDWILPDRSLSAEMERICSAGHLCGADLWHIACALFVSPDPSRIAFLTLNTRQTEVARQLGFPAHPPG